MKNDIKSYIEKNLKRNIPLIQIKRELLRKGYTLDEINKAGYIDKIYFQNGSGVTGAFNNFRIYLCHSNLNIAKATNFRT